MRNRARAPLDWVSQGQPWGKCRVRRRAERVSPNPPKGQNGTGQARDEEPVEGLTRPLCGCEWTMRGVMAALKGYRPPEGLRRVRSAGQMGAGDHEGPTWPGCAPCHSPSDRGIAAWPALALPNPLADRCHARRRLSPTATCPDDLAFLRQLGPSTSPLSGRQTPYSPNSIGINAPQPCPPPLISDLTGHAPSLRWIRVKGRSPVPQTARTSKGPKPLRERYPRCTRLWPPASHVRNPAHLP